MQTVEIGKPLGIIDLRLTDTKSEHIPIYMTKINEKEVFVLLLTIITNEKDPLPCYRIEETICSEGEWFTPEEAFELGKEELISNETLLNNLRFPCYFILNERFQYLIDYLVGSYQLDIEDIEHYVSNAADNFCYYQLVPSSNI